MLREWVKDIGIGLSIVVPILAGCIFVPKVMIGIVLVFAIILVAGILGSIIRG